MGIKEKTKGFLSKALKLKKVQIALAVIATSIVVAGVLYVRFDKEKIDNNVIASTLQEASELTSVKLNFKDVIEYEEGTIPYFDKASFTMVYEATARVGIDFKQVEYKINEKNKSIDITIPKSQILDVSIKPESIKFYDEHNALFKDEKNNTTEALKLSREAAAKQLPKTGILEAGDKQSAAIIKSFFTDNKAFDGYQINVSINDNEEDKK